MTDNGEYHASMFPPLLILYGAVPVFAFACWFIDLWAKSYDFPLAQLRGWLALAGMAAATCAVAGHLGASALGAAETPAGRLAVGAALVPALLGLVWCIHDVNWRIVYAASVLGPLLLFVVSSAAKAPIVLVVTAMSLSLAGVGAYSQLSSVRLSRYTRLLREGCWCCGYKQRAVRELCSLGPPGEIVIREYLSGLESWQAAPVRAEWHHSSVRAR